VHAGKDEFRMIERPDTPGLPTPGRGVYGISVAAELSGVAVQSLRLYERHGLLQPARSDDDLARLRRISELVAAGINLAGIARILDLQDDNAELLAANRDMGMKTKKPSQPKADGA
jgi:MerR family transcriptional regulator/heat shock protein HspR